MRKSQILSLQWPQINFEQGIITLSDTKNHERRDIPMDETVKATLQGIDRTGNLTRVINILDRVMSQNPPQVDKVVQLRG